MEYLIIERRERLTSEGKVFELLLNASDTNSPGKRLTVSAPDWQTFALGDSVGCENGRLWHKELPDQPIEVEEKD